MPKDLGAPNMRVQRTRSPLTRRALGQAGAVLLIAILGCGCSSTSPSPAPSGVLAYQTPDGLWHDDVARVVAPRMTKRVDPVWPPEFRTRENQGTVVMKLLVSREGLVQEVVVTESVNKVMDRQAVAAARQWGYSPATLDGVPVPVWLEAHVGWHLS